MGSELQWRARCEGLERRRSLCISIKVVVAPPFLTKDPVFEAVALGCELSRGMIDPIEPFHDRLQGARRIPRRPAHCHLG